MKAEDSIGGRFVRLGPFVVDLSSGEVTKNQERIHIPEQPTRLLLALLERPGEIVSPKELRTKLWPDHTNVEFSHGIHAAINKLRQALGDSTERPQFIETIPRRGYRLVAITTAAVSGETQQLQPAAARVTVPAAWHGKTGLLIAGGTAFLTLAVLIATLSHFIRNPKSQTSQTTPPVFTALAPRRIAIIGFRNLSNRGESGWLSTAFSEMLATELGTNADLQTVSGEDIAQMKRELSLADADSYTQQTLQQIRQNLGTEFVLVGSFVSIGKGNPRDRVRFDIHLLNTSTGRTEASLSETGTVADLFDLTSDAGLRLRLQLGVTPLSSSEQAEIRHSIPTSGTAQGLYFLGLEKIRNFDYGAAREVLVRAIASDRKSSLAHEALSTAYSNSGYESLAAREAQLAFELASGLTYEQGLRVEARYYETKHAWTRAEESWQRLCRLSPRTLDFALRLARVQSLNGKQKQAMATLEQLRSLARAARDEAQIDLAEASVEQQSGDFKGELAAAKAAATAGEQAHAPLVTAQALRMQGAASEELGDNNQALGDEHQAERIFETLRDPGGLIDALTDEGDILSDLGDLSAAETAWRKALAITRDTGNKLKEAVISNNLGNALLSRGEPQRARDMYHQAKKLFVETDYKTGQATSLLTTGDAFQTEGRLQVAKKYYEQSLQLSTKIGNQEVRAEALEALSGDLAELGDAAEARRIAQQAISVAQENGDKPTEDAALIYLSQATVAQGALAEAQSIAQKALANADALAAKSLQAGSRIVLARAQLLQGDTEKARTNLEQALALAGSIKADMEERETRYSLAELAIEEQRMSDAREMLRLLRIDEKHSKNVDVELECLILQAELELLDRQNDAALSTALQAQSVSRRDERFDLKMSAAEVLAKAAAASRKWTHADQVINSSLQQASESGCVAWELKARLSECTLKADREAPDASLCFKRLQRAAQSKGFGQIAKNAALGGARQVARAQ